ncbi:hypothetical protein AcV5_010497 [Taiwanofungus camphoratus]|nr:hypothetical protein AcV5_010497 [Antrodia cinnamomea]
MGRRGIGLTYQLLDARRCRNKIYMRYEEVNAPQEYFLTSARNFSGRTDRVFTGAVLNGFPKLGWLIGQFRLYQALDCMPVCEGDIYLMNDWSRFVAHVWRGSALV